MLKSKLFWLPLSLYILIIIPVMWLHADWHVANYWYQLEGQQWALRHHWFTQALLHDVAHDIAVTFYVVILSLFIASFKWITIKKYKQGLAYLTVSLPVATLSVSLVKHLTHVDCPWSISDFGGKQAYQSWWQSFWAPLESAGHCFPAAHASSAYMFFGLYFFSRHYWPRLSSPILVTVIIVGIVFGFAQQLRGAHFISHDLTSAIICWLVTYFLWQVWQRFVFKH